MRHRNARLTIHGRLLLINRVRVQGWAVSHTAAAMGISRQCAHRWLARYDFEGEAGLADRSSAPHHNPRRTPPEVEARVVTLRQQHRRGQDWIGTELGVPARTVSAILRRHQLPYLTALDPITGEVIRASKTTAVRYERDRPGDLVHMDVKKLGRIPDGGGWRALGRAATQAAKSARFTKIGFDYVHSLVDDHSRLAYSEILPDETGHTAAAFLTRAAAYFADHGIPTIHRVMTDNALAYRRSTAVKQAVAALGARQLFIKPHCPWQNGKVERLNRTLATEWAYRQPFTSNQQRTDALAPWIEYYNTRRRHTALHGATPNSRTTPSPT